MSFFVSKQERGRLKHDAPGKARFHLAAGVFPIRYRKADVDGLVSSDGDKSRGWKKSVHILSPYFLKGDSKDEKKHK